MKTRHSKTNVEANLDVTLASKSGFPATAWRGLGHAWAASPWRHAEGPLVGICRQPSWILRGSEDSSTQMVSSIRVSLKGFTASEYFGPQSLEMFRVYLGNFKISWRRLITWYGLEILTLRIGLKILGRYCWIKSQISPTVFICCSSSHTDFLQRCPSPFQGKRRKKKRPEFSSAFLCLHCQFWLVS